MTENTTGLQKHNEELNKLILDSLSGALIRLMREKPFHEISVTELCKRAGVSRMAYYNNFETREDILTYQVRDLIADIWRTIGSPFRRTTGKEWYVHLFTRVKESRDILLPIFAAGFRHKYLSIVNDAVLHEKGIRSWEKYKRLIWSGGVVNTTIYWLENGMQETVEEIAAFCCENLTI